MLRYYKKSKLKLLSFFLAIKAVILVISITLNLFLYFKYDNTKKKIEMFIEGLVIIFDSIGGLFVRFIDFFVNIWRELSDFFNNRELAIGILIIFVIVYALSVKNIRNLIPGLFKTALDRKLMYWYITMITYFIGIIFLLKYLGFWEIGLIKDSIIWFLVVGFVATSRAIGKARDKSYFILFIKDNLKIIVLIEFISNMYAYSLVVEVILVFITTFLVMMVAFIEHSPNYQDKSSTILKKFLNTILIIIGTNVIYHSIRIIILKIHDLVVIDLIKEFMLPIILSVMFVPYMYILVIVTLYEVLFNRINFKKTIHESIRFKLKIKILIFCNINISRVSNFLQRSKLMQSYIRTDDDIKELFSRYKEYKDIQHTQEGSNFS